MACIKEAIKYMRKYDNGAFGEQPDPTDFTVYVRADRRGLEVIKSTAYGRDRTRESYWVFVKYTNEHCIGRTLFFVLASWDSATAASPPPAPAAPPPVRFAVCDLYVAKDRVVDGGGAIYTLPDVSPAKRFRKAAAGIRMTSIHSKVVRCFFDSPTSGESTF